MYSYEQDEGGIPKSSGTVKRAVLQAAGPFVKKKKAFLLDMWVAWSQAAFNHLSL